MLLGQSQEWQVALEALTGTRTLSGKSMLNYYQPLKDWLDTQNANRSLWVGRLMHHLINLAIAVRGFYFAYIYASIISVNPSEEIVLYYKSFGETPFNQPALVQQVLMIVFLIQWALYIPAFILKTEKFYDLTGSITYIFVIYVVMNMVGGHSSGGC